MMELIRRVPGSATQSTTAEGAREWLVTNGLGGYASGTLSGSMTRRFHGVLIAALLAPLGRVVMLSHLSERLRLPGGRVIHLGDEGPAGPPRVARACHLAEFRLEAGLPVWRYEMDGFVLEKRLLLIHMQNTAHIGYHLLAGSGPVRLKVLPTLHMRPHDAPLSHPVEPPYAITAVGDRYEISAGPALPPLRLRLHAQGGAFTIQTRTFPEVIYQVERERGYDSQGDLYTPGYFRADLHPGGSATLVASTESWVTVGAISPEEAVAMERERRVRLLAGAGRVASEAPAAELCLAADQFIIAPIGRIKDAARARATGDDVRTVIAGYPWFTDWGRDTMISLEGLTLTTGRHPEAGYILRTFAHYVRDGLIPNLFPEGDQAGLYHTADATLWFFHAVDRYLTLTGDRETLRLILPTMEDIIAHHLRGTRFGIAVDPRDGLLRQGQEGFQLTWMDAKVGDWVVTPRRGKAVEINALFYNALRLLEGWVLEERGEAAARPLRDHALQAGRSFNARFFYPQGGYLYDVIDGEFGDDPSCRPNQIFALSLRHPVLDASRWETVLETVRQRLLTPLGLRSLAPGSPDYKARYFGDLRARDAAYHQGTVWAWLIGPFVDAWLRVHPAERAAGRGFLLGFLPHLNAGCIGSISEIFDAEAPYAQRGCIAQAWSVAEVLRAWARTST